MNICIICSESIDQTGGLFLSDRTMSRSLENGSSSIHRPRQEVWTNVAAQTRKIWRQFWRQTTNLPRKTLALSRPVHGFGLEPPFISTLSVRPHPIAIGTAWSWFSLSLHSYAKRCQCENGAVQNPEIPDAGSDYGVIICLSGSGKACHALPIEARRREDRRDMLSSSRRSGKLRQARAVLYKRIAKW